MFVRLQKVLAEAGVASRRASEKLIREGRVEVDGKVVTELGTKVAPASSEIRVDGEPIQSRKRHYIAVHKPRGVVCTRRDTHDRPTILDLLPAEWDNLYPVGRLDRDSEGLIFVTNDGDFCLRLTHPRYRVQKVYEVLIEGKVEIPQLRLMEKGIMDRGERLKASRAHLVRSNKTHSFVEIELLEGKNREIRRLFSASELKVERLVRVQIGPIKLGELPEGKWRTLTDHEIKRLLKP